MPGCVGLRRAQFQRAEKGVARFQRETYGVANEQVQQSQGRRGWQELIQTQVMLESTRSDTFSTIPRETLESPLTHAWNRVRGVGHQTQTRKTPGSQNPEGGQVTLQHQDSTNLSPEAKGPKCQWQASKPTPPSASSSRKQVLRYLAPMANLKVFLLLLFACCFYLKYNNRNPENTAYVYNSYNNKLQTKVTQTGAQN